MCLFHCRLLTHCALLFVTTDRFVHSFLAAIKSDALLPTCVHNPATRTHTSTPHLQLNLKLASEARLSTSAHGKRKYKVQERPTREISNQPALSPVPKLATFLLPVDHCGANPVGLKDHQNPHLHHKEGHLVTGKVPALVS